MENQNSKIKIAFIGYGYWGPNLARNFFQLPEVEISYICDQNHEKLAHLNRIYPAAKLATDYQEVLDDPETKAVCIATPLSTHFKIAKAALLAQKDVLIEKPMVENSKEAKELIDLAKEKGRILMVDHTFIYSGAVQKIKDLLDKDELGKLYYYDSERINLGLIRSDANVISDLAVHDLSIIDYLFSQKPLAVSALSFNHISQNQSETASINIRHENDFISFVRVSWLSPLKIRKTIIGASKKMVLYNDVESDEKIRIYDKGIDVNPSQVTPFAPLYRSGDIVIPKIDQTETLKKAAQHFVDCVNLRKQPLSNGEAGLRVAKLLEAISESVKEKGREILIS